MNTEYWKLTIVDGNGSTMSVAGSEEVLRGNYDEIKACLSDEQAKYEGKPRLIEIHGATDTYDRSPVSICFMSDDVRSVGLTKMA